MKNKSLFLLVAVLFSFLLGCSSQLILKEEIQTIYNNYNTYSINRDFVKLFSMLHKDFTYTDETGKIENRDSFIERVRKALSVSRNVNYGAEILELRTEGDKVTANTIYSIQLEYQYNNEWHSMNEKLNTREIFIKDNGKWLILKSEVLK
jgi:hypothetical protein